MPRFSEPERLSSGHLLSGFDCGVVSLNIWLEHHSRDAGGVGSAQTYVLTDGESGGRVVGYHALTVSSIEHEDATGRAKKGMPRHQIPAVLLARLAVDVSVKGEGVGAFLLTDALKRSLAVADQAGVRLILVHALDESARRFYEHFGFEESPTNPNNLQMLLKDVRASLNAAVKAHESG